MIDKLVLALVVIGALNWGSIGIFQFDLVVCSVWRSGIHDQPYCLYLVALAGVWAISFFSGIPKCIMKRQENDGFSKTEKER